MFGIIAAVPDPGTVPQLQFEAVCQFVEVAPDQLLGFVVTVTDAQVLETQPVDILLVCA